MYSWKDIRWIVGAVDLGECTIVEVGEVLMGHGTFKTTELEMNKLPREISVILTILPADKQAYSQRYLRRPLQVHITSASGLVVFGNQLTLL